MKKNKVFSYVLGYFGEILVILWLKCRFYNIIEHRYRCKLGEIDIIASKNKKIVFVEVKTSLKEIVVPFHKKQSRSIISSAKYFLAVNNKFEGYEIAFSLYFLSFKAGFSCMENAWHE